MRCPWPAERFRGIVGCQFGNAMLAARKMAKKKPEFLCRADFFYDCVLRSISVRIIVHSDSHSLFSFLNIVYAVMMA